MCVCVCLWPLLKLFDLAVLVDLGIDGNRRESTEIVGNRRESAEIGGN